MRLLNEGDVIKIIDGHKIYVDIPKRFIFENTPTLWELYETDILVGEKRGGFDTSIYKGFYIVIKTEIKEKTVDSRGEEWPEGHHVFCKKIINNAISDEKIHFFQTGCFTAMITLIKPYTISDYLLEESEDKYVLNGRPRQFILK